MKQFLLAFLILANIIQAAIETELNEAQVFEWWDDGIIDSDEAREILDLLEEGNDQEACILAEVYALESCSSEENAPQKSSDPQKTPKDKKRKVAKKTGKQQERPSLVPHGYAEWRGRTDSLGHLESQRTEIRLNFYRYSLRLGSQSLLTYKNAGSEAYFGQVSTKELHNAIPLDTLWGTAMRYPLGMFRIGALLDTALTTQARIGLAPRKNAELDFSYWHHQHSVDSIERHSFSAQMNDSWGNFAIWWVPENKGDIPLIKLQLYHREKMEYVSLAWKADAYIHGDSLPREAHLSSTIAQSRFWGSQTIGATFGDAWKSKFTINARTIIPLEGDSSKTRFKAMTESGPSILRGSASATCLQAEDHCRQNDLALKMQSAWHLGNEQLIFSGKARARHTRDEGFGPPHYEAGATYDVDNFNRASIAVSIPKGKPIRELQLRSSTEVGFGFFQFSLAVTFRRTSETPLHPIHAAMKAKVLF